MRVEKTCSTCNQTLSVTMFHKRTYASGKVAWQTKCKSCSTTVRRQYYKPNEKTRQQLKISNEFYEELMKNEQCNICGDTLTKKCIDHDHMTKKIRGVLCNHCNTALGLFKDDVSVLEKSIRYLERSKQLQ